MFMPRTNMEAKHYLLDAINFTYFRKITQNISDGMVLHGLCAMSSQANKQINTLNNFDLWQESFFQIKMPINYLAVYIFEFLIILTNICSGTELDILKVTSLALQTSPVWSSELFPACVCQRGFLCKRGMKCQRSLDTGSPWCTSSEPECVRKQPSPSLTPVLPLFPSIFCLDERIVCLRAFSSSPPDSVHSRPQELDSKTWRGLERRERKRETAETPEDRQIKAGINDRQIQGFFKTTPRKKTVLAS